MENLLNIRKWACALVMVVSLANVCFAGDWWDGGSDDPTDTVKVTRNEAGKTQAASHVNWQDGYIEVMAGATADTRHTVNQAHAYAVALKTARHLAYEKLAETVRGLRLSSNALYDRELLLDSNLKTELTALIRNARVIKEENHEFGDGSLWVEVTLGLNLYGKENAVIQPALTWQKKRVPRRTQVVTVTRKSEKQQLESGVENIRKIKGIEKKQKKRVSPTVKKTESVTGLIVDARGLNGQPAMLPRILSEDGSVLYSGQDVSEAYLRKIGLMGYQNSLEGALKLERVGTNPLVVNALATAGRYHADFVLSREDVTNIRNLSGKNHFLEQCRVAVVLGDEKPLEVLKGKAQ